MDPHSATASEYCPSSSAVVRHFSTIQNKTANIVGACKGSLHFPTRLEMEKASWHETSCTRPGQT
jgi:hypothetical protein